MRKTNLQVKHKNIKYVDFQNSITVPFTNAKTFPFLFVGIIITAALAVLVGCRATVVRRRTRRGGKSQYAHDADFLVNGMYL